MKTAFRGCSPIGETSGVCRPQLGFHFYRRRSPSPSGGAKAANGLQYRRCGARAMGSPPVTSALDKNLAVFNPHYQHKSSGLAGLRLSSPMLDCFVCLFFFLSATNSGCVHLVNMSAFTSFSGKTHAIASHDTVRAASLSLKSQSYHLKLPCRT